MFFLKKNFQHQATGPNVLFSHKSISTLAIEGRLLISHDDIWFFVALVMVRYGLVQTKGKWGLSACHYEENIVIIEAAF